MSVARPARPRLLLVLLLALVAGLGVLAPATPAGATSYGGAVSGTWPTTWTAYTYANGTVIGDTNSDQTPPYMDLASGTCSSCVGNQPSVLFANDGTSAFFRMRMAVDNNDASKGGLFGGAFLVQIADASNTVRAVVGVDGKQSGADNVYVTNAVGGTTQIVYEYPFTGTSAGMRWIPVGDGTGQYFLDFQVPVSVINTVSSGAITPTTSVKLYYGSSAAANLATINKDLMIPGASSVDFTTLAVKKLIPPTYGVTFDSDGGSAVSGQTITEGDPAVEPTAPTRSGYTFSGWFNGASAWSFSTPVTGATTLTAHWARPSHAVTFDSAGGSAVASQNVEEGSAATQPTAPTRTGYTFAGWYDGASAYDFSTLVSGPVALTAHWTRNTYAVTFDSAGGSAVSGQTVNHGDPAVQPSAPTRSGYTFDGWFDGATAWSFATAVTGTLALTAHWSRVTHAVTFDSDGGSAVATQHVDEGSAATEPTAPTRTGWTFTGWYDGTTAWDFTDPITGATALTAHWTHDTYAVTFDADGGSAVTAQTIAHGDLAAEPTPPTRSGYTFTGWFDGSSAWSFATPVTGATTLTAHWTRNSHAVTFDADGGSPVATQTVDEGTAATQPAAPTRTGHTFAGWYDGASAYDFSTLVSGPVALTAHWTRNSYAVTFDADGGSTVTAQTIAHGDPATEPTAPTRAGWTFTGWYDGTTAWDFTDPITGATTLTAHWVRIAHTVTFDSDGGSAVAPQDVEEDAAAVEPTAPTRTGWTFTGWFHGATAWDFTDPITDAVTLTAHWTHDTYVVIFDSAGGTAVTSQTIAHGDPAVEPTAPTRTGWTFTGWYDGATAWDFTDPITDAVTLTAHWTHDTYAVTFDSAGGTTVTSQTITHGDSATQPTTPTRVGYTFDGWFDGASAYDFSTAVTGPVSLTAHWTAVTYTVNFVTHGGTSVPPIVVGANGVAIRPPDPVRSGYVFLGWYDGASEWDFDDPITATTALSALWAAAQNDVTFDSAGGSLVATQSVAYGDPATTPGTPTRSGFSFAGWFVGATAYDFSTPVTGPVSLTAHWTAAPTPVDPDPDSDHDGLSDATELARGTDPNRADTDGDGINDFAEVTGRANAFHCDTDPLEADTDGDGLRDGRELRGGRAHRTNPCRADTDRDGLDDRTELTGSANGYGHCGTDPVSADSDGDGLEDGSEVRGQRLRGRILIRGDRVLPLGRVRTDPCRADTDRDGLSDGRELGGTRVRSAHATYRSNPLRSDTDRDGLTDRQEVSGVRSGRYHHRVTDPMNWDTDNGGVSDGFEVNVGSDPTDIGSGPAHPRALEGI